jgi:membrane-bound lytic murein transglycosylase B
MLQNNAPLGPTPGGATMTTANHLMMEARPMSVRDLTMGQLDVVFHAWLGAAADFEAEPRLAAWRPSVEAMLARVRTTSASAAPDLFERAAPGPTTAELDRTAEAAVRTLAWAMSAVEQNARADGNTTLAAQAAQAFAFVFERGLRFLGVGVPKP